MRTYIFVRLKVVIVTDRCIPTYGSHFTFQMYTVRSVYRLSWVLPSAHVSRVLGRLSASVSKAMVDHLGFDGDDFNVRMDNDLTPGVLLHIVAASKYLECRRRGIDVSALRYDDLVARPLEMCRVVLEFCRLPVSLAEPAIAAFDIDSQRDSPIAQSVLCRFAEPEMTSLVEAQLNALLAKHRMPLIGENAIIEGTLTC